MIIEKKEDEGGRAGSGKGNLVLLFPTENFIPTRFRNANTRRSTFAKMLQCENSIQKCSIRPVIFKSTHEFTSSHFNLIARNMVETRKTTEAPEQNNHNTTYAVYQTSIAKNTMCPLPPE